MSDYLNLPCEKRYAELYLDRVQGGGLLVEATDIGERVLVELSPANVTRLREWLDQS